MRRRMVASSVLVVLVAMASLAAGQEQTATQFYMTYRAAFDKAQAVEEILPYMSAERRKQVESMDAEMRKKMFGAIKAIGSYTGLKVVKETRTDNGATLAVEAVDSDKAKVSGTISIVREDGQWKLGRESFKS